MAKWHLIPSGRVDVIMDTPATVAGPPAVTVILPAGLTADCHDAYRDGTANLWDTAAPAEISAADV